ncbi:hypothetical protein PEPS_18260 [Persicobacter psychrovividus]|uniref:DUF2892 domain-containing protein n=1 Tax=Persicobacter psychrovividus TaxID=387638 RepID=A0ABM7VEZ3_9BACT|nr:hypothetical protein PEPS_18260 [Persicobacter psychrovividus]
MVKRYFCIGIIGVIAGSGLLAFDQLFMAVVVFAISLSCLIHHLVVFREH